MTNGPSVLALDLGSTRVKAGLFDGRGSLVGAVVGRTTPLGADGTADPDDLAAAVEATIDEALTVKAAAPWAERPAAVALACSWHGLVGLDGRGVPVTRFSTWADARAADEVRLLQTLVADPERVRRRTGAPFHPSLPPARLLHLRATEPDRTARVRRWCALGEYLQVRWAGPDWGPSLSLASGSGLLDLTTLDWDQELVEVLGLRGTLARPADEPRSGLLPAYRGRWPALSAIPWFPFIGDGAAATVGVDATAEGLVGRHSACLTVGTTAAVRTLTTRQDLLSHSLPPALFGYLLDADTAVVGAARSNAGNLVSWAKRVLRLGDADLVLAATAGRAPGGHGLQADPSLAGERSPHWPPDASGGVAGLRQTTTALDVLQALVEAGALGIGDAVAALEAWAGPLDIRLTGGAAGHEGWRRLLADTLGQTLRWLPDTEASARGAALMALRRLGLLDEQPQPPTLLLIEPDPARAEAFARLRVPGSG